VLIFLVVLLILSSFHRVEFVGEMRISRFLRRFKSTAEKTIDTLPDGKCRLTVYDDDEQPLSSRLFIGSHTRSLSGGAERERRPVGIRSRVQSRERRAVCKSSRLAKNKELAAKNKELAKMMQTIRDLTHQFDDPTSNDSGDF
jgi:hypothetical protein